MFQNVELLRLKHNWSWWESALRKGKLSRSLLLALVFALFLPSISISHADMGMVPVGPSVSVYEPGQKAIVAWNGQEETLILSTDVNAVNETWVLQIMPLPSNPKKIEKASFESFVAIQDLLVTNARVVLGDNYLSESTKSVEITFHERIGAHDITVVKAANTSELMSWAEDFLESNNVTQDFSLENFETVIEEYMARGFRFFALDIIQLSADQKSVEPILYQFETSFLYYPLKISSPISGNTKITLFLLTNGKIESNFFSSSYPIYLFTRAYYQGLSQWEPIELNLTKGQLSIIDLRLGEFFSNGACLTVVNYEGPLSWLTKDFMISETSIMTNQKPETPSQDNSTDSQLNAAYFFLAGIIAGAAYLLAGAAFIIGVIRMIQRTKNFGTSHMKGN